MSPSAFTGSPLHLEGGPLLDRASQPNQSREQQPRAFAELAWLNQQHLQRSGADADFAALIESDGMAFRLQAEVADVIELDQVTHRPDPTDCSRWLNRRDYRLSLGAVDVGVAGDLLSARLSDLFGSVAGCSAGG